MIEYVVFMLVGAVLIGLVRVARGPTIADRVLAADTINVMIVGIAVSLGLFHNNQMFIDIAIVYAVLAFLGNLAVSKYVLGKEMHEEV